MTGNETTRFNRRSFNVMIMMFTFILLPFSGIIIHSTHGMDERESLSHFAMSVHNLSAIIFSVSSIVHLISNRKAIAKYFSDKTRELVKVKREAIAAFLFVFVLVGMFAMHAFHAK